MRKKDFYCDVKEGKNDAWFSNIFRVLLMTSPYPWAYTLRWPFYYNWPSQYNHTGMLVTSDQDLCKYSDANSIRLLFCGDIMVQNKDRPPKLDPALCKLIQSADLFIGNCESPLGENIPDTHIKYRFIFRMPRSYLEDIIEQTGLSSQQWLLSMANNHAGDLNYQACLQTYDILKDIGITPLGRYQTDKLPFRLVEFNGWRLGFVAWTNWMNREIFPQHDPGVFRMQHISQHNWLQVKEKFQLDYIIGIPHWGYEFQHFPYMQTRTLAKSLIDQCGMGLIVGSHTHSLQPMEQFKKGLCFYSLGNFCGLGRAWSIKLIPILEVCLTRRKNTLLHTGYKLHYFIQTHRGDNVEIIPLQNAEEKERVRLEELISRIYDNRG